MNDCCDTSPTTNSNANENSNTPLQLACPTNQQIGKAVDSITLKSLLALPLTEIRPIEYRFCRAPDCPTVYYSVDGNQVISEDQLRERVYQKHSSDPDTLVCYCFQHTVGSIQNEIFQTGHSTVIKQINEAISAGLCACDLRNPQGTCCLGNVREIVKQTEIDLLNR